MKHTTQIEATNDTRGCVSLGESSGSAGFPMWAPVMRGQVMLHVKIRTAEELRELEIREEIRKLYE